MTEEKKITVDIGDDYDLNEDSPKSVLSSDRSFSSDQSLFSPKNILQSPGKDGLKINLFSPSSRENFHFEQELIVDSLINKIILDLSRYGLKQITPENNSCIELATYIVSQEKLGNEVNFDSILEKLLTKVKSFCRKPANIKKLRRSG